MNKIKINNIINQYYSKKIIEYGPTPSGVDWNGTSSQMIRFEQISKVILEDTFSISDIGCGYGKYYEYLNKRKKCFKYFGYDLSTEMIKSANSLYGYYTNVLFNNINDISESDSEELLNEVYNNINLIKFIQALYSLESDFN